MEENDGAQLRRIEHLADGFAHRLIKVVHAGVDEGRALIRDEELVERGAVWRLPGRDAVNAINDFADAGGGRGHEAIKIGSQNSRSRNSAAARQLVHLQVQFRNEESKGL
ncbi:MAG TPA: hypothetical protein VG095_08830, partial [Chthoniobacterales bacterium]|nr:hypothetical protein [Chthoniobacterales bacterium]